MSKNTNKKKVSVKVEEPVALPQTEAKQETKEVAPSVDAPVKKAKKKYHKKTKKVEVAPAIVLVRKLTLWQRFLKWFNEPINFNLRFKKSVKKN